MISKNITTEPTGKMRPYISDIGDHIRACAPPASATYPLRVLVIQEVSNLEDIEKKLQEEKYPTIKCKDTPDTGFRDRLDIVYSAPEESIINVINFDILLSDDCETLSYVRDNVKDKKIICVFYTKLHNVDTYKNISKIIGNYNISIKFMNEKDFVSYIPDQDSKEFTQDYEIINSVVSILENNGFKPPDDANIIHPTIRMVIDAVKSHLISATVPKNKLKAADIKPSRLWSNRVQEEELFDFIRNVYKEWIGKGLIISYFKEIDEPLYRELYRIIYRKKISLPNDLIVLKNHEKPLPDKSNLKTTAIKAYLSAERNYHQRRKRAQERLQASH